MAAAVAKAFSSQEEATVLTASEIVPKPSANCSFDASQTADDDFDDFDPRGTSHSASGEYYFIIMFTSSATRLNG